MIGTRSRKRRGSAAGASTGETRTEERIRVLWLIKGLGRGGAEVLLLHAARIRDRDSFDCEVGYLLGSRGWLADDLRVHGVPVHLFASERHVDLRWAFGLRRYLRNHPVDIVHVHSPFVAAVARLVVRSVPRSIRPVTISTEHLPWTGHAGPTRFVNSLTFPLDGGHLAVSSAVRESIPRRLRRDVRVLVHGVPVADIRAHAAERNAVRAELGVAPDEVVVVTVANATAQKGYADLFAAAREVLDRGRRVRFVLAGRGTQDREIQDLRERSGTGDHVIALGPVEDAAKLMAGCDVFALASHWEGLPLVLMEAAALGLPAVATRVGGVPELVRDGVDGLLVPDRRPDLFADALDRLILDRGLREQMGRAAADGAARFDNQAAVRTIEAFYRDVVAKHRPIRDA